MALSVDEKQKIIKQFGLTCGDTGSPEVQIALLNSKIKKLSKHLKEHKKDFSTRRGLIKMVGRRRKLLRYLSNSRPERYAKVIEQLGLKREDAKITGR